jgi:hypothetical protein
MLGGVFYCPFYQLDRNNHCTGGYYGPQIYKFLDRDNEQTPDRLSTRKAGSSAAAVLSTATRNWSKNSAGMIRALAVPASDLKPAASPRPGFVETDYYER